ncbi:MAG: Crp/Fnr family transcriptional regulator [Ruminococcus sp.]|nr:Crp/Fnr family transcriptional regulator [Ruminococcus sp.]
MKKYFDVLRKCPLFIGIADEHIFKMLNCLGAKSESFDKKYTIIGEGNPAKFIGILLSGSAQIEQMDYYGNRTIVGRVEPSQLFSEAFACAQVDAVPVSVIANEPCDVFLIDCSHILHTCQNNCSFHQQMIFNLMKNLAVKIIVFHQKIEITSKRTTREKLMSYLMFCAKEVGSNSFDIPYDRQELADFLEVDRSGLSAEISKLRKEGVLTSTKKHFELL